MATAPDTHPVQPCPPKGGNPSLTDAASDTNGIPDASTRQLDFYQAMRDFKLMFPNMDEDVIEAVLRANNGAVDDTIDQLLTMNVDGDGTLVSGEDRVSQLDGRPESPIYMNQDLIKVPTVAASSCSSSEVGSPPQYDISACRFDPPSYNDCLSHSAKPSPSHSATPPRSSATDLLADLGGAGALESGLLLDTLEGAIGGYIPKKQKQEQTPEKTLLKKAMAIDEDFTPAVPPMMSLLNHDYIGKKGPSGASAARPKRRYRDWNPPMLGTLPDDFLRFTVTPPSTPEHRRSHSHHSTPEHQLHQMTPQHLHHVVHHQVAPPTVIQHPTPHRVKAISPQRAATTHAHTLHHHHSHSGRKERTSKNMSGSSTVARSQSLRNEPGTITVMSSRKHPNVRTVTATHGSEEISSNLIQRKIAENERARACTSETMTPEQAQVLEDERLALLSQNGEFLQVLMRDADFMKTLERDHMNATAFETRPSSVPTPDQAEGYGTDHQAELGAFPFSQMLPRDKDENAEFQRQLTHMGGLSKKKFSALAKKFFTRKKKQKKVLRDTTAPSTANLLEDDDTDEEFRDAVHPERSVGYDQ